MHVYNDFKHARIQRGVRGFAPKDSNFFKSYYKITKNICLGRPLANSNNRRPPSPLEKKLGSAHDERGLPLIESLYHKATLLYFALITQRLDKLY